VPCASGEEAYSTPCCWRNQPQQFRTGEDLRHGRDDDALNQARQAVYWGTRWNVARDDREVLDRHEDQFTV
jgi:chemotaxis methyl-accepting protein methylase